MQDEGIYPSAFTLCEGGTGIQKEVFFISYILFEKRILLHTFVCDGAKKTIMIMTGRPSFHSMKCYKYSIVHQAIDVIFYVYSIVFVFSFCSVLFDIIH